MFNSFVLFTALRYFKAKKREKFVSIISAVSLMGITLGVAALIIVMSVMNGFHVELTKNIIGLNGDMIIQPSQGKIIENDADLEHKLKNQSYISRTSKIIQGQALAMGEKGNNGVLVKGIELQELKHKGEITQNVLSGNFDQYYGEDRVAIGSELAWNLGAKIGSRIKLVAPNLLPTIFGSMPRSKSYEVVAIFSSGMYDYDAMTILMPLDAARIFFSIEDGINLVEVNVDDITKIIQYSTALQNTLGEEYYVQSWMDSNRQFLNALKVERTAMFVILSLIILVAAFNIISSLFMLVKDKTSDIAILKTIGASNGQIMAVFMLSGMMIGIIGTIIGAILGLLFSYNIETIRQFLENFAGFKIFDPAIYFLYQVPSVVELSDIVFISSLTIILSFIATIYPAYKAASLNPVEVMKYE